MMSMEVPSYLDTGSPHNSTPTSPSFVLSRQPHLRPPSRPTTPAQSTSLDLPPGISFAEFLRGWNDQHVARWLADSKCGHHAQTFANNDIRGDILLDLDQQTLREMGITSVGDRVKILNGVKSLRAKCSNKSGGGVLARSSSQINGQTTATTLPLKMHTDTAASADTSTSNRAGHKRLEHTRPPPLHLTQTTNRTDLPVLVRNDSRENTRPLRPLPLPQASTHTHTHSASSFKDNNGVTRGLPPLPPPPRTQPPQAPSISRSNNTPTTNQSARNLQPPQTASSTGRRTPTPMDLPPSFTQNPLPPAPGPAPGTPSNGSSTAPWSGEYGLPRGPSPGNLVRTPNSTLSGRSTSPLPPQRPARPVGGLQAVTIHSRAGSSCSPSSHLHSGGPTQGAPSNPIGILTPIQENFGSSTPSPPTATTTGNNALTVASTPSTRDQLRPPTPSTSRRQMSAEDIRRRCVKFILADDGHSRLINVEDIPRGTEILEFVLRKFGKSAGIGFPSVEEDDSEKGPIDPDEGLAVGGWGVFLGETAPENPGKHLSETELLLICHDEHNPAREHGLTLRRVTNNNNIKRSKQLTKYFGESPPRDILSPPAESASQSNADKRTPKQLKRASTISILSGLGVPDPERALVPPLPDVHSKPSSPTPSMRAKTQSKLHNFHGHRPPSELITTHLQEYFPYTEKKVLERTHRQSMMFRNGRPDSIRSGSDGRRFSRQSWMPREDNHGSTSSPPLPPVPVLPDSTSIRSMQSGRSFQSGKSGLSVQTTASQEPPRMSVSTEDGHSVEVTDAAEPRIPSQPLLLPPVEFPTETETLSETLNKVGRTLSRTASNASRASRRTSYLMELRNKRDRSDTASMLTVDEITQEVESRRASFVADGKDSEGMDDEVSTAVDTGAEEDDTGEEDGEETMHDDSEEIEEEESKIAVPETIKRRIKWIRGALIGQGSFGSVYLGMNSHTGLLMAVKQVELPTGSAPNEERKKSMLNALEREIELLKELQHENIVQYLDSFSDGQYLNIFLEYVPGGSVATLLKNYGAFEEGLVRNFVRQILQGLNYLHERDIIHRDIKGGNILVDNKGGIKISDFGISKKVEDSMLTGARLHRPSLQGSVFWMAPEVVKQTSYTLKADIWSVGCLVVEMLTGEHPWAQLTQMQAIFKIGSSARPACPSDVSADAEEFLNRTFELDHNLRPSAAQLLLHAWTAQET